MKKLMAAVLSVFMFFGVPFPVYALEQLTSPQEVSVESIETLTEEPIIDEEPSEAPAPVEEEITEAPVETPSEEESKPLEEAPAAEEPDVLSPEIKQEVPSETVIELPETKEEPTESPKEELQAPAPAGESPVQEEEESIEELEEFIPPVNYTQAGALLGAVLGARSKMGLRSSNLALSSIQSLSLGDDPNIHLSKSAVYNGLNNTVDITLEAFVTGNISTNIKKIPVDIVLVLDQSGSMSEGMNGGNASPGNRKIDILKNVLNGFVDDVIDDATEPGKQVNHRISMVGFAYGSNYSYQNTEILTTVSGNPIRFGSTNATPAAYRDSLVSVGTASGQNMLDEAINDLSPNGATSTDIGLLMAKKVYDEHDIDPIQDPDGRQRVVILLTDGVPTTQSSFSTTVANNAIAHARDLKNAYGATVYTIGIYSGANPSDTTTNTNKFMNFVSSNYKNAASMSTNVNTRTDTGYFLSASNASELDEIFTEISNQIENPGNTSLTGASVLKDILTPQFHFSDVFNAATDVDIKVYNYTGNGTDYLSPAPWSEVNPRPGGITATVNKTTKELQITGFDYTANFVATGANGPRGKKIVVKFTVDVNDDFIGGNQVITNENSSGIYTPNSTFAEAFPVPDVDVPLRYLAQPEDKGVYISQSIPANELIAGSGLSYKTSSGGPLYTVDGYNNAYADLEYILYDTDGTTVLRRFTIGAGDTVLSDELNLLLEEVENKEYTFTVKVTPIYTGTVTASSEDIDANLYVWVPKVTATDHEIWWGEQTDIMQRMILNGFVNPDPSAVTPLTLVPAVTLEPQFIAGSTVNSIPAYEPEFDSTFKIRLFIGSDEYTSHTVIVPAVSGQGHDDYHFTILVKKAALTIEKKLKAGSVLDENQSFLFLVEGPTGTYQVAIQGLGSKKITGLKLGDYKVTEITSWSFRYDIDSISIEPATAYKSDVPDGKIVELTKVNHDVKLIFTNRKTSDKWLSGDSYAVNLQGQSQENGTLRREEEDEE